MKPEASPWKITLSDIEFDSSEESAVMEVLRSKWLSTGPKTAEFEARFAEKVGCAHAVALSNCTAALHLSLLAVGVGPGDEVIVPSLTFVATANAVLYCGATPVFGDIEGPLRLTMDPRDAERKITPRTRAVVPMHYAGYACDMEVFREIATRHSLRLVDDAAHAPGSTFRGARIGSLADASCFSFFANKNLVTGEGGMVTTGDERIAEFVRRHRSHGMTALSYDKHRGHAFSYDVVGTGYNYRMTEIQAAVGLVQLEKLDRNNARRRSLVRTYRTRLSNHGRILVPFAGEEEASSCHLFVVVLPQDADRDRVQGAMKSRGIQTSVHYPPVHLFSSFRDRFRASVPRLDEIAGRLLTLPLHPLMSDDDVGTVCDALEECV